MLLLLACAEAPPASSGASFEDYAGPVERLYELRAPAAASDTGDTGDTADAAPPSDTSDTAASVGPTRWLRTDAAAWTLSEGDDVDTAVVLATLEARREGGLFVDRTRLLPARVVEGAKGEGMRVQAIGPWTTWYGTFERTAEVAVATGRWTGTQVFAEGVGPVYLTIDGKAWETVWYE